MIGSALVGYKEEDTRDEEEAGKRVRKEKGQGAYNQASCGIIESVQWAEVPGLPALHRQSRRQGLPPHTPRPALCHLHVVEDMT